MKIRNTWLSIITVPGILLSAATGYASATGELWETHGVMTSKSYGKMDMGINRECQSPGWRDNPTEFKIPGGNDTCKSKKIEKRGNGLVWKFDCGATRGEGSSKMIGSDRMQSSMHMESPQGEFHLDVDSRKVGTCDPGKWKESE